MRIAPKHDSVSITCGRKQYLLPVEDVTVLPLVNTTLEALAGYLLTQVLPQLLESWTGGCRTRNFRASGHLGRCPCRPRLCW
ncbi:MAG: hypothetical protein ACRDTA_11710 [Pseudonocardiaceae bacterium]